MTCEGCDGCDAPCKAECKAQAAGASKPAVPVPAFAYQELFEAATPKETLFRKLDGSEKLVSTVEAAGHTILKVEPEALRLLAATALHDISHLLRPAHLAQLRAILDDTEASSNDKFVATQFLKNACVAAGRVLPSCQDTGTATVVAKKGQFVWTDCKDEESLSRGVYDTYTTTNLRYSQVAPMTMYAEKNTGTNLPAQIDIFATPGMEYKFLFVAKGGGSANKTYLYQQTKALLTPTKLMEFLKEKVMSLGTAACPPYHLSIVIGGLSADMTIKTAKLLATKYYDNLPTSGSEHGRAFRDTALEEEVHKMAQQLGIGAQFGGKYFCHDVRIARLPRHGASCPVALAVSCSADRQCEAKITKDGIFIEQLEEDPAKYLPEVAAGKLSEDVVKIDLNQGIDAVLKELTKYPTKTRLSLSGALVVARDIAHANIMDRISQGQGLPQYMKDYAVYYAGPAKTPAGMASGSFGPTTAGRMDSYVDSFQALRGSMIMLAKGNRSAQVTEACKKHGGFYLGSIGGPAAVLAKENITKVEVLDYAELGMEAVWKIEVVDFPAFIIVDDKGNDFFGQWQQ